MALTVCVAGSAGALPVISEIYYDAAGSDNGLSFVEIFGTPGTSLEGMSLEGVNGGDGAVGPNLTLSGVIPADGVWVVADDAGGGVTQVAEADQILNFDFQNGPDSIVLRLGDLVLDGVGYGDFAPEEVFAGEGAPAPDGAAGQSLARRFADVDSGNNVADFLLLDVPTPGVAPVATVPEPGTASLVGFGVLVLVGAHRGRVSHRDRALA